MSAGLATQALQVPDMDPGPPDSKRPRLATSSWPHAGPPHSGPPSAGPLSAGGPAGAGGAPGPGSSSPGGVPVPSPGQYQQHMPHFGRPIDQPLPQHPPSSAPPPPPPPPPPPTSGPHHHPSGPSPAPAAGLPPPSAGPHLPSHGPPPHLMDDRRRHEQEPPPYGPPPLADHSRPPSTHGHAFAPPPFPHRDPVVKRDPSDDHMHAIRRPSSTSAVPDGLPGTPNPSTGPPPSPYPDDARRPLPYEQMAHGHGPYRHNSYAPPVGPPAPYEAPSYGGHAPPPGEVTYGMYPSQSNPKQRKATRASQACDSCRQLKAKCDETKPCKSCREKGLECKYRDPIPKATDKAQADILDGINDMKTYMKSMASQFIRTLEASQFNRRLEKVEAVLKITPGADIKTELDTRAEDGFRNDVEDADVEYSSPDEMDVGPSAPVMADEEEDLEYEPGQIIQPGEPAMPVNHTTLASLLLEWPSIKNMVQLLVEKERIDFVAEYPIRQEQERGVLRVYGRGEGHDSRSTREDHGALDIGDDFSDASSMAGDWGVIPMSSGDPNPDFSPATVWSLIKSFKDNIMNMHPLVAPSELDLMVQTFLDGLPGRSANRTAAGTPSGVPMKGFAIGQSPVEPIGSKRKRSPSPDGPRQGSSPKGVKVHRTINNAVVLAALALGKICQYKEGVPDVVHVPTPSYGSPLTRNGVPMSPTHMSPPSSTPRSSTGLPSPNDFDRRRSSHGGGMASRKKNFEVLPGLEYFAYATDIIGNQLAGATLKHVWANILAGLYHGQLGRVMESYAYISNGSKALQIILRPMLDRFKTIKDKFPLYRIQKKRENYVNFAFWTCLQLESDILAELPLPHSGILAHEENMPYPEANLAENHFGQRVVASYLAQLYLRRHLNTIHKSFYHPTTKVTFDLTEHDVRHVEVLQDRVDTMEWVHSSLRFHEDDPPADDILAARLRAKYWGAQVITYRPIIRQILNITHNMRLGRTVYPAIADNYENLNPKIIDYAKKGIRALVESTRAFHALGPDRPIITNVFGTAHAQWGNMLVLAATSQDPLLSQFIDRNLLRTLFTKTISFLQQSSTSSCNLGRDMRILEGVERFIFEGGPRATFDGHHQSVPGSSGGVTPFPGPPQPISSQQDSMAPPPTYPTA